MPQDPHIDILARELASLVAERQRLRSEGADSGQLERNRREIVARQHELAGALIALHAPHPVVAAA